MGDLVSAILVRSANDAAAAIAEHLGGSIEGFAELMNEKAAEMGLTNSHFVNPHGLDTPEHYSSAADLLADGTGNPGQPATGGDGPVDLDRLSNGTRRDAAGRARRPTPCSTPTRVRSESRPGSHCRRHSYWPRRPSETVVDSWWWSWVLKVLVATLQMRQRSWTTGFPRAPSNLLRRTRWKWFACNRRRGSRP